MQNPYSPPQAALGGPPPQDFPGAGGAVVQGPPEPWAIGEVFNRAFDLFKRQFSTLLLGTVVIFGVLFLVGGVIGAVEYVLESVLGLDPRGLLIALVDGVRQLVMALLQAFLMAGYYKLHLAVIRGQPATAGMVFGGGDRFLWFLLTGILQALCVMIGFLLLIVPGVILVFGFSLAGAYAVDTKLGPIECLKASWRATLGHKLHIFGFSVVAVGVILGGVMLCFVGVLPAMAWVTLAQLLIYARLSGRTRAGVAPVANPWQGSPPVGPNAGPPPGYGLPPLGGQPPR